MMWYYKINRRFFLTFLILTLTIPLAFLANSTIGLPYSTTAITQSNTSKGTTQLINPQMSVPECNITKFFSNWNFSQTISPRILYTGHSYAGINVGKISIINLDSRSLSPEEYRNYRVTNLNQSMKNFKVVGFNQIDIDGIQVEELTYTASPIINGVVQDEMKVIEIFSIEGKEVPTVIFSSNSRSFQTFQQTINPCDPLQIFLSIMHPSR